MNAITLKTIPDSLIENLRLAATAAHRSLNKEIISRLERSFMTPSKPANMNTWDATRVNEQVEAWGKLEGEWVSDVSVEAEIEALYAARTPGRDVPTL